MPPTPKKEERGLDPAKLQEMHEPLTIRVERVRGNQRQPIEIPGREGAAPGTGWSREEVLKLETWLVNEWTGGGCYRFMVVDAQGTKMEWDGVWDPRQFPERAPPNLASATAPTAAPVVVAPQLSAAAPSYTPPNAPLGQVSSFWPPPSAALGYGPLPAPPAYQPAPPAYPPLQGPWGTPPSQFVGPWGNNFGVSPTPPPMLGYTPYAYTPPTSYATPLFGNRIREDRYETDRY